ncbi:MAG: response regulator, partial [Clostridiales Family XIII bacterium]|nr:response regulator [Clostridiales Family XIII bacterium]
MKEKILIVEDEREIADLIELYLLNEDFDVRKFCTAKEALACIADEEFDLAVLDLMLPDADGFSVCRKIRESYTYPIIML